MLLAARLPCAFAIVALAACAPLPADGGGEGEGEPGPVPRPLDPEQVRLGTAVVASDDVPAVPDDQLPNPPAGVVAVDLGAIVVGDDGATGTILVDVDDRVRGLTVVAYGQPDAYVLLTRADAADGTVVVDDTPPPEDTPGLAQARSLSRGFPAQFFSPGRVLPGRGAGAFVVPSSADVPLAEGTWSLRLGHFDVRFDDDGAPTATPLPRPVRVVVLVRTAPVTAGRLGLALHFTGSGGLTAAAAEHNAIFQDVLDLTRVVYGGVDIDVDDVVYRDLPDGEALRTVVLDEPLCEGGDLDDIVVLGEARRINVFFVDRFECGPFGPFLLGMSPGIPGVPWTSGTTRSGVVVAGSFLSTEPDKLAVTIAHELGHFLGLYHSQENDRFGGAAIFDNIADTGVAPESRDNLMFFDVSRIGAESLSPGQGATLRRGAVVLP